MAVDLAFQQGHRRPVDHPSLPVVQRRRVAQPQDAVVNDHSAHVDGRGIVHHKGILRGESGIDEHPYSSLLYFKYPTRCIPGVSRGADKKQIRQDLVVAMHVTRSAAVVVQGILPGLVVGKGRHLADVRVDSDIGHRVEQVILLAEVPVDAGDSDAEMFGKRGHAELVERFTPGDLECAGDDLFCIDRPSLAPLADGLRCGLGHCISSSCCSSAKRDVPRFPTGVLAV